MRQHKSERVSFFQKAAASAEGVKPIRQERLHIQLDWRENPTKVVCVPESGAVGVKGCGETSLLRFPACLARLLNFSSPFCLFNASTQIL